MSEAVGVAVLLADGEAEGDTVWLKVPLTLNVAENVVDWEQESVTEPEEKRGAEAV